MKVEEIDHFNLLKEETEEKFIFTKERTEMSLQELKQEMTGFLCTKADLVDLQELKSELLINADGFMLTADLNSALLNSDLKEHLLDVMS